MPRLNPKHRAQRELNRIADPNSVYLGVNQAGKTIGVSGQLIANAIRDGLLTKYKFGRRVLVSREELLEFVKRSAT